LGRRELLAALASGLPAASLLPACAATQSTAEAPSGAGRRPGWAPTLFSTEQALTVEDVAEQLIPETNTPGARSAGVPALIESLVEHVFDEPGRRDFLAGIAELNAAARQAHGRAFPDCTPAEQKALLETLAAGVAERLVANRASHDDLDPLSHFWLSMRELTINGFVNSRLGATRVLSYEPTPGEHQGCVPLESAGKTWAW
jgi:hypothetical protein